jgi:succinate dehydrogenase / fumarate reductase cytochrome b subunit
MPDSTVSDRKPRADDSPSPAKVLRWFDPRDRDAGSWAFILNRLTALGLTFYLGLHLIVLHRLVQGPAAYDAFLVFSQSLLIKIGEVVLIAAVVFHGLNGIRLTLHAFGIGIRYQKRLFALALAGTALASILFALRLFGK